MQVCMTMTYLILLSKVSIGYLRVKICVILVSQCWASQPWRIPAAEIKSFWSQEIHKIIYFHQSVKDFCGTPNVF